MILVYLLITVMPMIRHPLWSDVFGDLTVVKYLGMLCMLYALIYLPVRNGPLRLLRTWQARFFVLFALLVIALFLVIGGDVAIEISPLMSFASFLMFFFITLTVVDSLHRLRMVLLMAIASVAYASLHVLREWQKYGDFAAGYRPGWVTGDPNYYSLSALLCVPIALYLLKTEQPRWERWLCIGSIVVTVLGLTLAASRGGFVGMVAASLFVVARAKRRFRSLVIVTAVILPLMVVAPSSPLTRIFNPDQFDIYSADHRMDLAAAGMRMFQSHLLTGIGPGNFKPMLERFADLDEQHIAHNTYVSVMAEMGVPGILLFAAVILATFVSLERVRRATLLRGPLLIGHTAEALQVCLVGFLAAAFFVTAENHRLFWLIIFISMVLPPLAEAARAETPVPGVRRVPRPIMPSTTAVRR
jgi:O-antigen ligase